MDGPAELQRCASESVDACIVPGSNYPAAYRRGVKVRLELDEASGDVIVTRSGGAVKLGYLIGPDAAKMASCLRAGRYCGGRIEDVCIGPTGKQMHIRIEQSDH